MKNVNNSGDVKPLVELIKACDDALTKCKGANEEKDKLLKAQRDVIAEQSKRIESMAGDGHNSTLLNVLLMALGSVLTIGIFSIAR